MTQATELGTVYEVAELEAIAESAHAAGMLLHVDGARLANAAASLGAGLAGLTTDVGVDAVSFGGTKNGLIGGEAVVFPRGEGAEGFEFVRKQCMQLASKMRFISAQLEALLADDLWLRSASHANAMATRLATAVGEIDGVEVTHPVEANGVFARLPRPAIDRLLAELPGEDPFYIWDEATNEVRWMCSWDTTETDVDEFAAAIATPSPRLSSRRTSLPGGSSRGRRMTRQDQVDNPNSGDREPIGARRPPRGRAPATIRTIPESRRVRASLRWRARTSPSPPNHANGPSLEWGA